MTEEERSLEYTNTTHRDQARFSRLRSMLFIPALQEAYVDKAVASSASAFILDLEDSIGPDRKSEARQKLPSMVAALEPGGRPIFVRINSGSQADIEAVHSLPIAGIIIPKVSTGADIDQVVSLMRVSGSVLPLLASIESAQGLSELKAIVAHPEVRAIMYGAADFIADAGLSREPAILRIPALLASLGAKSAGLPVFGLASMIDEFRDLTRLEEMVREAKGLGFSGTPVIHPAQIDVVEKVFAPTQQEIEEAQQVVAAFEASDGGASTVGGQLIEHPSYLLALDVLSKKPYVSSS